MLSERPKGRVSCVVAVVMELLGFTVEQYGLFTRLVVKLGLVCMEDSCLS